MSTNPGIKVNGFLITLVKVESQVFEGWSFGFIGREGELAMINNGTKRYPLGEHH